MTSFSKVYKDKKVFITGHTGFKGSWLLAWLQMAGATITGYSLAPKPEHRLFGALGGSDLCNSHFNDILDYASLESAIVEFEPDFIFHLAAQPLVRYSYEQPLETFNVNIIGTANVLNAIRRLSKPCVAVIITTDKVYQNVESHIPYREGDRLGGYDPYSASKACSELVIDSYRNSFFNPKMYSKHRKTIVAVRAGNVIGGGDWAKDRILPDIVRALQNNEPVVLRNPKSLRPWQHVLEPLHAYLLLAQKLSENPLAYHTEYNFGPYETDCLSVETMVQYAISAWKNGNYTVDQQADQPHEAALLKLDINRAMNDLQWRPIYDAAQAIEKTISWYQRFDGKNAGELVGENIQEFEKRYYQTSVQATKL